MQEDNFKYARKDYLYMLEKNYPQKGIIKLIGDRYALSGTERTMLYRGITTSENCLNRKKKHALVREVKGNALIVDGYNVMITIGSYLNGNTVFISNDNFLRDAAEMHGKVFRKVMMDKVLGLLLDDLDYLKISDCIIYFDKPVSKSGELAAKVNAEMIKTDIRGYAQTANSPDFMLKHADEGFIATSDSSIIDKSPVKTFDLARHVISRNFKAIFPDLRK